MQLKCNPISLGWQKFLHSTYFCSVHFMKGKIHMLVITAGVNLIIEFLHLFVPTQILICNNMHKLNMSNGDKFTHVSPHVVEGIRNEIRSRHPGDKQCSLVPQQFKKQGQDARFWVIKILSFDMKPLWTWHMIIPCVN